MIGSLSAQIALLAFAAAIVAGLCAGNTPATVLTRALVAMLVALLAGKLAAWTVKAVLRDHLRHKKLAIDEAHLATVKASEGAGQDDDQSNTTVGTE
jgi:hypothetical protein